MTATPYALREGWDPDQHPDTDTPTQEELDAEEAEAQR